jgi:putative acetyltransferase
MPIVRNEDHSDIHFIHEVNTQTFNTPREADLVDALREAGKIVVSLVAEADRRIIGHILFSAVTVEGSALKILGLAPMAVLPKYQRHGIGTALIHDGLAECRALGFDAVVVLGIPTIIQNSASRPPRGSDLHRNGKASPTKPSWLWNCGKAH